jgi:hypothetical protein
MTRVQAAAPTRLRVSIRDQINSPEEQMAFRRGGFALTPPSIPIFLISLVLAVLVFLVRYAGVSIPIINPYLFNVLAIAYVLLVIGVLVRRL